ncbi:hypothetical protein SD81_009785 [Tolypothrix campylonemoides VB511288]|nr:hypothetical protein SD81_009785 [Tolypothrix campylonemoides VB511288]
MIISDLDFIEVVSEETSIVGGYAQYVSTASGYAFATGQNSVTETATSGYAIRETTFSQAGSSSSSAGFASLTTPVPSSLTLR